MASQREEQVSALVDGEASGGEINGAISALLSDAALRERWSRYHLISDALRNNLPDLPCHTMADRVREALEDEPTILAPRRRRVHMPGFVRQAAGLAVAASVTAAAILGVQYMHSGEEGDGATPVLAQGPQTQEYRRLGGAAPVREVSEVYQSNLDPYLVNHNEYSVSSGMQGMLPYVRIVSDEAGR
jgi:sigma-E factor negative regulatory protein RseA